MCNRAVQEAVMAADAPLLQPGVPAAGPAVAVAAEAPQQAAHRHCPVPGRHNDPRREETGPAHALAWCRKVVATADALEPAGELAAPEIDRQEILAHAPEPIGAPAALAIALPRVLETSRTGPAAPATSVIVPVLATVPVSATVPESATALEVVTVQELVTVPAVGIVRVLVIDRVLETDLVEETARASATGPVVEIVREVVTAPELAIVPVVETGLDLATGQVAEIALVPATDLEVETALDLAIDLVEETDQVPVTDRVVETDQGPGTDRASVFHPAVEIGRVPAIVQESEIDLTGDRRIGTTGQTDPAARLMVAGETAAGTVGTILGTAAGIAAGGT
jgi:hypothetical protein